MFDVFQVPQEVTLQNNCASNAATTKLDLLLRINEKNMIHSKSVDNVADGSDVCLDDLFMTDVV